MTGESWMLVLGIVVIGVAAMILLPQDAAISVPPFVDAGPDAAIQESCSLRLDGHGYDPNGEPVEFMWTASGGRGRFEDPSDPSTVYTAPELCGAPEIIELTLAAASEAGMFSSDSLLVHVCEAAGKALQRGPVPTLPGLSVVGEAPGPVVCPTPPAPQNHPPYADAGGNFTLQEGTTVGLTCEGSDPDGDPVSFRWTSNSGHFDDPCLLHPYYTAPLLDCEDSRNVTLTLTVTDSHGASTSDSITAYITNMNRPPYADAGGNFTLQEGTTVGLTCEGSDPDGDPVSFRWTADSGHFNDPCLLHPYYTAPLLDCENSRSVILTLTVTDSHGAASSDSVIAYVTDLNRPPYADAGDDFTLQEGTTVGLTCEGSDPDGDPVSFHWTADSGRFDDPCLLHPHYTAPLLDCEDSRSATLTLTVTDSHGASSSSSVVVHVTDNPSCTACYKLIVTEGECVHFTGRVTDPDNNVYRHLWQASSGQFDKPRNPCTVYTAPRLEPCEPFREVEIAFLAEDTCGLTATDTCLLLVCPANRPPQVDAGAGMSGCGGMQGPVGRD